MANAEFDDNNDARRLRALVQVFIRDFGLLASNETPCGHPIALSHAHALMVLLESRRQRAQISQSDLANALGIDKSNVARLCSRMAESGHVTQTRDPADGRSRLISLADGGLALARTIEHASRARFRRLLSHIPRERRQALFQSLTILNEAVATVGTSEGEP